MRGLDNTDYRIIEVLREFSNIGITSLSIKSRSREGLECFRRRCYKLESKGILEIEYQKKGGRRYFIRLSDKFKKNKSVNI